MSMLVQNFIQMNEVRKGDQVLKLNNGLIFARKSGNINVSRSAAPKLALCQQAIITEI